MLEDSEVLVEAVEVEVLLLDQLLTLKLMMSTAIDYLSTKGN